MIGSPAQPCWATTAGQEPLGPHRRWWLGEEWHVTVDTPVPRRGGALPAHRCVRPGPENRTGSVLLPKQAAPPPQIGTPRPATPCTGGADRRASSCCPLWSSEVTS